jgi:hypothetical protein
MAEYSTIRLVELNVGWQFWRVHGPQVDMEIASSWIGDSPLDDLLSAAIGLHTYLRDGYVWPTNSEEWNDRHVVFQDEPGEIRLVFGEPSSTDIAFTLYSSGASSQQNLPVCGNGVIRLEDLSDGLIEDGRQILHRYGIVGYREQWVRSEFPLSLLFRLMKCREDQDPFALSMEEERVLMEQLRIPPQADTLRFSRRRP